MYTIAQARVALFSTAVLAGVLVAGCRELAGLGSSAATRTAMEPAG